MIGPIVLVAKIYKCFSSIYISYYLSWINILFLIIAVFPIPLTCAWVITKSYEAKADPTHCEIGYTFLDSYWILEGPRIAAIMVKNYVK